MCCFVLSSILKKIQCINILSMPRCTFRKNTKYNTTNFKNHISITVYSKYVINRILLTPILVITSGVPQGNILGPFLYLLFTSDILKDMLKHYHSNFRGRREIANSILQAHLNNIQNWLKLWRDMSYLHYKKKARNSLAFSF